MGHATATAGVVRSSLGPIAVGETEWPGAVCMELPAVLVGRGAAAFTQDELPQLHAQAFASARHATCKKARVYVFNPI
jgi:hypothetical protein